MLKVYFNMPNTIYEQKGIIKTKIILINITNVFPEFQCRLAYGQGTNNSCTQIDSL